MTKFENYHKHTTFSNFFQYDSATSIPDFINKLKERGCQCYFSTEHGYPGEWIYCYDLCKQMDIKFRYAAEIYWVKDTNPELKDNTNCHMVIIARTYQAIRKLNYIISVANVDGYYYKPRVSLDQIFTLTPDEVYITSGCIAGHKYPDSEEIWLKIAEHFGDSFFFEYQPHNTQAQKDLNLRLYALSQEHRINTIVGLDTHYISEEDRIKRDNLLKRKDIHYDDEEGWYMDFPDDEEIFRRFKEQGALPEEEVHKALENTNIFVDGCQDIELDTEFKIPILDEYKDYSYEERCKVLQEILNEQYSKEDADHKSPERIEAIKYEFGEVRDSGVADYFIDNYKIIKKAVEEYGGQITTTSRGSASSYYITKLLGFTTLDRFESEVPIFPERFITKDRILSSHQMPDIDTNICAQEPFVQAARDIVGNHGCYPLLAVGYLKEKAAFKMYAGVNGIEPSVANDITSALDKYYETLKNVENEEDKDSIEIEDYIKDKNLLKIYNESKPYQGIVDQARVHACGFCLFNGNPRRREDVGYGDIRYEIGLIRCQSESTGRSTIVANIEGGLLDAYGYVKDDFLIVDVVGIIYKLYHAINRDVPSVAELRKMVNGDKDTWDLYAKGITCCLNQCEKTGTTSKAMIYKPQNVKELAAFIAGIRPGFKSLIDGFLNRINYSTGEPAIDNLLQDSFNYMLYQEAIMKIFAYLGISMKDSYDTIKKISKKKLKGEALAKLEDNLKKHWKENIGNLDNFNEVYAVVKNSSRYGFNAPHALSMAFDSLYEAWMKAHHTSKFYEVVLNHYDEKNDKDKILELEQEAIKHFGYKMGDYEYGKDNRRFNVDDQEKIIYPSLASIKGIGEVAAEDIYNISQQGYNNFLDIYLSISGTKINNAVFENLVKIGYFQKYGSIKNLITQLKVISKWKTSSGPKKTISKATWEYPREETLAFATDVSEKTGKISDKQYRITDWKLFITYLLDKIPDDEYDLATLLKFKYEILGYIDYTNESLDNKLIYVTKLKTDFSPSFVAYSLKTGKTVDMKVHKSKSPKDKNVLTSFRDAPFEEGNILYMKKCTKKNKVRKTKTGWEDIPGQYVWWLDDYRVANL